LPVPLAPDAIVIQLALLAAVHAQALAATTVTVPGPPALPNDADVELTA
jgi:hypothetical protein